MNPSGFAKAFIVPGTRVGAWRVTHVRNRSTHPVLSSTPHVFSFPVRLDMVLEVASLARAGSSPREGLGALERATGGERTLYSVWGTPFTCAFGSPSIQSVSFDGREMVVHVTGSAVRDASKPSDPSMGAGGLDLPRDVGGRASLPLDSTALEGQEKEVPFLPTAPCPEAVGPPYYGQGLTLEARAVPLAPGEFLRVQGRGMSKSVTTQPTPPPSVQGL
jgi:hypothetical protein